MKKKLIAEFNGLPSDYRYCAVVLQPSNPDYDKAHIRAMKLAMLSKGMKPLFFVDDVTGYESKEEGWQAASEWMDADDMAIREEMDDLNRVSTYTHSYQYMNSVELVKELCNKDEGIRALITAMARDEVSDVLDFKQMKDGRERVIEKLGFLAAIKDFSAVHSEIPVVTDWIKQSEQYALITKSNAALGQYLPTLANVEFTEMQPVSKTDKLAPVKAASNVVPLKLV